MNKDRNIKNLIIKEPLKLDCGQTINNFPLAYETYGNLNEEKGIAISTFQPSLLIFTEEFQTAFQD